MPDITSSDNLMSAFNPGAIPTAIALVAGTIIAVKLSLKMLDRLANRFISQRLVLKQVGTLLAFVAYALAFVLAFNSLFRLSSQTLLALTGTAAVTIGFALKDVAAAFLAGIFILISKPFQVGDRISFGGFYGEVTEIGLRSIRLVTLDDNLVTIPSNKMLTDAVASANAGALDCMVVTSWFIEPTTDHEKARQIVYDAMVSSRYLYLGKPFDVLVFTRLSERGTAVVELMAKAYVFDMRFEKHFQSDVNRRVLSAFNEQGIIPAGAASTAAAATA